MADFDVLNLLRRKDGSFRVDPTMLYPPFAASVLEVLRRSHERGADYYPTSGLRWFDEQAKLRALYEAGKGHKAAPAGLSAHQYGLAVDCAPDGDLDKPGLQPDYSSGAYAVLVEEVELAGLVSGRSFGDVPHVQWPGYVSATQLHALRRVWLATDGDNATKLRAVWAWLDAQRKATT